MLSFYHVLSGHWGQLSDGRLPPPIVPAQFDPSFFPASVLVHTRPSALARMPLRALAYAYARVRMRAYIRARLRAF